MDKELKITEARVKEAADSCGTAKEALTKLFPEVFESDEWNNVTPLGIKVERDHIAKKWVIWFTDNGDCPFYLEPSENPSAKYYKIDKNLIWRRKSRQQNNGPWNC